MLIGQNLELDMPRLLDELLHVELAVAESIRRLRVTPRGKDSAAPQRVRTMRMPRPPPPALAFRMTG